MKNSVLAEKIVTQLGTVSKQEQPGKEEGDKPIIFYVCSLLDVAGLQATVPGETKKAAVEAAIEYVTKELDEGNLILSDTWAEDNLK